MHDITTSSSQSFVQIICRLRDNTNLCCHASEYVECSYFINQINKLFVWRYLQSLIALLAGDRSAEPDTITLDPTIQLCWWWLPIFAFSAPCPRLPAPL